MGYVTGQDRYQITFMPKSLDEYVDCDNPCRVIDAFVNRLDLEAFGFKYANTKNTGRHPFNPADMLKLYMYGYQNKIRSSRRLEKETVRNIEVMWLLNGLTPDDKTISNFRSDNRNALKKVFRAFNQLCMELGLFGKRTVSVDGSKIKANNSSKNHYTEKSANEQLARLEKQITEYLNELERNDKSEDGEARLNADVVKCALEKLHNKKVEIEEIVAKIKENEGKSVCTVDEDAALMKQSGGKGFDVCHNVQTSVDEKFGMVVEFKVTSQGNDMSELSDMVSRSQEMLGVNELNVLTDGGYSNGIEIHKCEISGATCYVPKSEASHQPKDEQYNRKNFEYNSETDCYTCPAGHELPHVRTRERDGFKVYANRSACKGCAVKSKCTKSKTLREIERSPYQESIDRAAQNVKNNPALYRRRQELSEHPFGVVKRVWGYDQFLCRGNEKVTGEMSLSFLAFNLRRAISILGIEKLLEGIKQWAELLGNTCIYYLNCVFIVRRTLKTHFVAAR